MKKTKAIIILPGYLGSKLFTYEKTYFNKKNHPAGSLIWIKPDFFDVLDGDLKGIIQLLVLDNGQSVLPLSPPPPASAEYGALNTYSALIKSLNTEFKNKYNIIFFSYDWRLSLNKSAYALDKFIKSSGFTEIILVAHSMGGLLGSFFISEYRPPVTRMITLGTPFLGAPKVLNVLLTGNALNPFLDLFVANDIKDVCATFPTAYAMLPNEYYFNFFKPYIYDFSKKRPLSEQETNFLILSAFPVADNYLRGNAEFMNKIFFSKSFLDTHKVYICGTSISTIAGYTVDGNNLQTLKPVYSPDGDGTVPLISSNFARLGSNSFTVKKVKHTELVKNGFILKTINALLQK